MRVLHVIPSLALVHGGPSQAIGLFEQACRLQKIQMDTIATDDDGPGRHMVQVVNAPNESIRRFYFRKNFEFYKVSIPLFFWLWRNIKNYDVVHIHALFSFSSTVSAIVARLKKVPYIVRPLGTLNQYGRKQRRPFLKNLSIKLIEAPALKNAAAIHFTSAVEKQEAENIGVPMKSVVLPLAVNPFVKTDGNLLMERFPKLQGQAYLLFMSRLDPKKNIENFLQAFKQVNKDNPTSLKCVMAGDGVSDYVVSLKKFAEDTGIAEDVVWTGHLQSEIKNSALSAAQMFVLPSFSENFGIAAAEALSAGLPCILSNGVALAAEAEQAGAAKLCGTDVESIAFAISELMQKESLRSQMAIQARNHADSRYSVSAMGCGLQKLYDDVMCKASRKVKQ